MAIPTTNLFTYWKNEAGYTGSTFRDSEGNLDVTIQNHSNWQQTSSLDSDVINARGSEWVDIGEPSQMHPNNITGFTVFAWVQWFSKPPADSFETRYFFCKGSQSSNDNFVLRAQSTEASGDKPEYTVYLDTEDVSTQQVSGVEPTLDVWQFVSFSWDRSTAKLYLDGTRILNDSSTWGGARVTASGSPWSIGSRGGDSAFCDVWIGPAGMYTEALSDTEHTDLYQGVVNSPPTASLSLSEV